MIRKQYPFFVLTINVMHSSAERLLHHEAHEGHEGLQSSCPSWRLLKFIDFVEWRLLLAFVLLVNGSFG
jgi:hypothetical protein